MTTADAQPAQSSFQVASAKTLLAALSALSSSSKQVLGVTILASGVIFRCEDDGKACQAAARHPAAAFAAFAFNGSPSTFCVQLGGLLDALRAFAALEAPVRITEAQAHLVLETAEPEVDDGDTMVAMYAHVTIVEGRSGQGDLQDHWQPPATEFACAAALLREAVDDLEWPQGHVDVAVSAQPLQVMLSAAGQNGSLGATLPPNQLRQVVTQEAHVTHKYPYKFLRAALTGAGLSKAERSTKVDVDANGLLKVVHMLPAARSGDGGAGPSAQLGDGAVVLTYLLQPLFDADADFDALA